MTASFIFCYARSGGTLLNRCLNNLENVVVLSEVHPVYDTAKRMALTRSIAWQAQQWHGVALSSRSYADQVCEMYRWCRSNGKHLVIRDWSFADFTPTEFNGGLPANRSTSFELLRPLIDLKPVAFVRDAIDVGLSRPDDLQDFAGYYRNYLKFLLEQGVAIFRYEDFCASPGATLAAICSELGLPLPQQEGISCTDEKVIGDTGFSRGNRAQSVVRLKRRYLPEARAREVEENSLLMECNRLLGYPERYRSCSCESYLESRLFKAKSFLQRFRP